MPDIITSDHYADLIQAATADPVVRHMAAELRIDIDRDRVEWETVSDPDLAPTHAWSVQANRTYRERGGTLDGYVGTIPEAVLYWMFRAPRHCWTVNTPGGSGTELVSTTYRAASLEELVARIEDAWCLRNHVSPATVRVALHPDVGVGAVSSTIDQATRLAEFTFHQQPEQGQ